MNVKDFVGCLQTAQQIDFFTGVPDSQLKALCDYLYDTYGIGPKHCIAHNEGGAVALAAGYYLSTGKVPCVYMQNSGIGNITNPVCSLTNTDVYGIPMVFVVGWRGEPGVHDEPQHKYQGKVTLELLKNLDIALFVVDDTTTVEQVMDQMQRFSPLLASGKSVAFVVRKGGLYKEIKTVYQNKNSLTRERAIQLITKARPNDIFVSTTGKASRELFEIRTQRGEEHRQDFLTVGSMGHSSMIALGIAMNKPGSRVFCIDGDGAILMHTGAMAVIGSRAPENFVHVVLNNEAHETVGGMPTVSGSVDYPLLAKACGYAKTLTAESEQSLIAQMELLDKLTGPVFLEVKVSIGARTDLGRPSTTPQKNRQDFMCFLEERK